MHWRPFFSDAEGNMYFTCVSTGASTETILVTPRAYKYDYVFERVKAEPNAVIGVGVVMADKPMYFDCANENGFGHRGLNFPGYASFAHEPIDGTINVATFEFPLWVARNFNTVDEVEEALKNVTSSPRSCPASSEIPAALAHGDGTRSIVIEQMADGMQHPPRQRGCAHQPADLRFPWRTCATTCAPATRWPNRPPGARSS